MFCPDPGNSSGVMRQYSSSTVQLEYGSRLEYRCEDRRNWLRLTSQTDSQLAESKVTTCHWRGRYDMDATQLECVLHHCRHPHNEPGTSQLSSDFCSDKVFRTCFEQTAGSNHSIPN